MRTLVPRGDAASIEAKFPGHDFPALDTRQLALSVVKNDLLECRHTAHYPFSSFFLYYSGRPDLRGPGAGRGRRRAPAGAAGVVEGFGPFFKSRHGLPRYRRSILAPSRHTKYKYPSAGT